MRKLPDDRFKKKRYDAEGNFHRLFIGIFPPQEYFETFREILRQLDKQKRNLRNVSPDQMHLTLRFIGAAVTSNSLDELIQEFKKFEGKYTKPTIEVRKVQFGFSHQSDPRVVMLSIEENDSLNSLQDDIHAIIKALRLRDTIRWKEKNLERYHISLSRLKPAASRSIGRDVEELIKKIKIEKPQPFQPEHMYLVESIVGSSGPTYKEIAEIRL